ncbi:MAG: hypothetical protein PVI41_10085 [Roseobacter sp.]
MQLPDVPLPPSEPGANLDYPRFVPIDEIRMSAKEAELRAAKGTEEEQRVTARANALRARAARLRSAPVE